MPLRKTTLRKLFARAFAPLSRLFLYCLLFFLLLFLFDSPAKVNKPHERANLHSSQKVTELLFSFFFFLLFSNLSFCAKITFFYRYPRQYPKTFDCKIFYLLKLTVFVAKRKIMHFSRFSHIIHFFSTRPNFFSSFKYFILFFSFFAV